MHLIKLVKREELVNKMIEKVKEVLEEIDEEKKELERIYFDMSDFVRHETQSGETLGEQIDHYTEAELLLYKAIDELEGAKTCRLY